MVDYDSIIPPGQAGKLTQVIKSNKLSAGRFSKGVTVVSNASNDPSYRLMLTGTLLSHILPSTRFIHLRQNKDTVFQGTITLATEMEKFAIDEIVFEPINNQALPWRKSKDTLIKYTVNRSDTTDTNGYYSYHIDFSFSLSITNPTSGKFIMKTNHPQEAEVAIRGMLSPSPAVTEEH